MIIIFSGPDGSGKTTLALKLAEQLEGFSYTYFGENKDARNYKYFKSFINNQRRNKLYFALRYVAILINDFYVFNNTKNNIITDRSPIDKLFGTKYSGQRIKSFYHTIVLKIFRKPDLIIILTGDIEKIYQRKKEISKEKIQGYIDFYTEYTINKKIKHIIIDTVENSPDKCINLLIRHLYT